MTPGELAHIHAASFTRPRPWTASEFASLLDDSLCFLLTRRQSFILGRVVLDEAELLTLAVWPDLRRQGAGRELLAGFEKIARERGALSAFLEVASDNLAARSLYAGQGWQEAGRRRAYYGAGLDGLIMRKELNPA